MPDSPLAASPYEVLGVARDASDEELRKAFRRRMRETHPDAGGSAAEFHAVRQAWELIETRQARAAFDRGGSTRSSAQTAEEHTSSRTWAPAAPRPRQDTRAAARSSGHPGGWFRERYLAELREWAGRGVTVPDPYDAALGRSAPRQIRHLLAAAVAEEESARQLATLGIGFTLWHDIDTRAGKLDHVALGPTGLWAIQSEDWGAPVSIRKGELISEGLPHGERPMHEVATMAKVLGRDSHARFTALVMVVPDDATDGVQEVGRIRGVNALLCGRSRLVDLLRTGIPGVGIGGTDLFELRSRLQAAIHFV